MTMCVKKYLKIKRSLKNFEKNNIKDKVFCICLMIVVQ